MNILPKAQITEIVEQEIEQELLIYNLQTNKAYNLNKTLKTVFKACDGKTSLEDLKKQSNLSDEVIYLALDQLQKNALLEDKFQSPFDGISRREVIRRVGLSSMALLPVISALVAPSAVHAASTSCPVRGQCYRTGTVVCPPGCNRTLTCAGTPGSNNGTCSTTAETPRTINCRTLPQGTQSIHDFRCSAV